MTISGQPSRTDWERVKKQIAEDAPIPYDATDPDDGPYDPNDDESVDRFLTEANRIRKPSTKSVKKIAKAS
ncbi:MAG TPA: hypothetical protein VG225_04595 [Terracidiphilus sp.]|jgi:hypothetical protein|nr:hypothetical protein [Terracidiphilus sp.]